MILSTDVLKLGPLLSSLIGQVSTDNTQRPYAQTHFLWLRKTRNFPFLCHTLYFFLPQASSYTNIPPILCVFTGKHIVSKHLSERWSIFSCRTEEPLTSSGAVHCAVTFSDLKKPRKADFSLWTMTQPSKFTVVSCCPLRTISQTCLNNYTDREGNHSLPNT